MIDDQINEIIKKAIVWYTSVDPETLKDAEFPTFIYDIKQLFEDV